MSPEPEAGGFVQLILLYVCIIFIYYTYSWIQEIWVGLLQARCTILNTALYNIMSKLITVKPGLHISDGTV